jgi:hypothetical protein
MEKSQWLPLDEWWYNTYYHTTTHVTPFEVVYGQSSFSSLILSMRLEGLGG